MPRSSGRWCKIARDSSLLVDATKFGDRWLHRVMELAEFRRSTSMTRSIPDGQTPAEQGLRPRAGRGRERTDRGRPRITGNGRRSDGAMTDTQNGRAKS